MLVTCRCYFWSSEYLNELYKRISASGFSYNISKKKILFFYCFCFYQIAFTHYVRVINFFLYILMLQTFIVFIIAVFFFRASFGMILRKIRFKKHTHCFQCKCPCLEDNNFTCRQTIFGLV